MSMGEGGVDIPVTLRASWEYDPSGQEAATQGLTDYYDQVQGVMNSVGRLTSVFMMLEMQQMRQMMMEQMMEASMMRVSQAQERYNSALQQFGAASKQAQSAHTQLEIAKIAETRAQERLNMMQMREYMEILPVGARIMSTVHGLVMALSMAHQTKAVAEAEDTLATEANTVALEEETTAEVTQQAFMGPAGWASLAAGVAVMGGMAAYTYTEHQKMQEDLARQQTAINQGGSLGSYQAGGIIPSTGMYQLHAGEVVTPSTGGGAGRAPTGDTNVTIHASPGMDVRELAHQVYKQIEFERRRGVGAGQ